MGFGPNWGQKKYGPQAKGIQIGPRVSRGGLKMPRLDTSGVTKGISQGLNAVGGFARGATSWRESLGRPSPQPKMPGRKSSTRIR